MVRSGKAFLWLTTVMLLCWTEADIRAGEDTMTGMVIGRTGEVLHISIPQPVREGAVFSVKLMEAEPPVAEARVVSCTQERPFIALAKVVRGDIVRTIATGSRAYTNQKSVNGPGVPAPMQSRHSDSSRFSLQAGVFYPSAPAMRDTVSEYWDSYRLSYSFVKAQNFEAQLCAEYDRGSGEFAGSDGAVKRTVEIMPITLMARAKPIHIGSSSLFLGAGGGMYRIRSTDRTSLGSSRQTTDEPGLELSAGIEARGWVLEMRYRNANDADIEGYSLTLGTKF